MSAVRQKGLTTVEFAIVGAVLLTLVFAALEFGRLLYSIAVLNEGARRAVRLAAVCPINDPAIVQAAAFGGAITVPGLLTSNVAIEYLNAAGGVVGAPQANFTQIRAVRVRIPSFPFDISIPFVNPSVNTPEIVVSMPRESLGIPRQGVVVPC